MKKGKLPREEFQRNASIQIVQLLELARLEGRSGLDDILVVLTIALALLDRYQGANVPHSVHLKGGEDELAKLTHPVAEQLAKEGGHLGEPRFYSEEFWKEFIIEAEQELKGFSKG